MKFLTEQKIHYLKQFGFRKKFSTAHAIINLIDSIKNTVDKNKFTFGVFIDFKKAFDTVDHEILLKSCGIMEQEEQLMTGLNPISRTECNTFQLRQISYNSIAVERVLFEFGLKNLFNNRLAFPPLYHDLGKTKLIFWSTGKTAKKGSVSEQNKNNSIYS